MRPTHLPILGADGVEVGRGVDIAVAAREVPESVWAR